MKQLEWSDQARKQFARLDRVQQKRVWNALERYAHTGAGNIRKLIGRQVSTWRLRIGDYRATFLEQTRIDQDGEQITTIEVLYVLEVGHRREIYE